MTNKSSLYLSIASLVIGVIAIVSVSFGSHASPSTPNKPVGSGDIVNQYPTINSLGLFYNGLTSSPVFLNWQRMPTMTAGQNQVSWLNNTGQVILVQEAIAQYTGSVNGVASSTLFLTIGTSTTATIADATKNALYGSLVDTFSISTSTNVTATSSYAISSEKNNGTNGQFIAQVQPGQYVTATLESPCPLATTGSGGACELATSTNRGYNLNIFFRYGY